MKWRFNKHVLARSQFTKYGCRHVRVLVRGAILQLLKLSKGLNPRLERQLQPSYTRQRKL